MNRSLRAATLAAMSTVAPAAAMPAAGEAAAAAPGQDTAAAVNPAIAWNRVLLGLQATPGDQPATVHPIYDLATMHAAIYDAVASIDHSATPYLTSVAAARRASVAAAADAAAHDTLVRLHPARTATIDQDLHDALAQVPARPQARIEGIRVGERVAARLLAQRAGDGAGASPVPFQPGTQPGDYPGAQRTISAAGADILGSVYGDDVAFTATSAALPGVERSFVSFSEAAQEAGVSRIYNGNHTPLDEVAGESLGHDVAGFVLGHDSCAGVAPRTEPRGAGTQRGRRPRDGRRPCGPHRKDLP